MSNDSSDFLIKFQNEKYNYEFEKTLILQKDEVKRLKDELRLIYTHIQESKNYFRPIISAYKKKAKSIRKEIESIPVTASIIKSKLISSHTKAINKLKHMHHKNLKEIEKQYSERMESIKISETSSQIFFDENNNYDLLNDTYIYQNFKNIEQYEIENQSKISVLNQQIAQNLLRSEELQEEIDNMKEVINQEHNKNAAYESFNQSFQLNQSNIKDSFHQIFQSQQDIQLQHSFRNQQKFQEDIQSLENVSKYDEAFAKEILFNELDQLRLKINQVKKRSQEIKMKIDTKYTDSSPELSESMQSLANLQAIYQQMQDNSISQLPTEINIHMSKKVLKQAIVQLRISVDDLDEVQKEHNSLLEEIKRLDFMVYGRKGRFQDIHKIKKRNHWI